MKTSAWAWMGLLAASLCAHAGQTPEAGMRSEFRVKYVAAGAVYLDGGRNSGLAEGMKLTIKRRVTALDPASNKETAKSVSIGEVQVSSLAAVSAVCDILPASQYIQIGDVAYLVESDMQKEVEERDLGSVRKYPQIISFNEGDPLEDEARASVPKPPLPEINRARGRVAVEYGGLQIPGPAGGNTTQLGLVLRTDISRVGGTYWNLDGYWRGRLDSRNNSVAPQTVNDLINRTYHLGLTYSNPNSKWVAGLGRLYLPWASSLDTIDGGYVGRRLSPSATAGVFAGSTPDPSSWDYNPDRRIAGSFINFEGGAGDAWRYTSTFGMGMSALGWKNNREFFFTENGVFYKQYFSFYQSLEADHPHVTGQTSGSNFSGIRRSFVTVHVQPARRVSLDVNHNYFREIPTFDLGLVSTGLVDKLLFQGLSLGARVELPEHITVYNSLGRSSKTGDTSSSWNQMYGVTVGRMWRTGMRGDVRYSKFDSTFGRGNYYALALSREFGEAFRIEGSAGRQSLISTFTKDSNYRTFGAHFDWFPKGSVYFDGGFTRQLGTTQDYNQWFVGLGYRFDSVKKRARVEGK